MMASARLVSTDTKDQMTSVHRANTELKKNLCWETLALDAPEVPLLFSDGLNVTVGISDHDLRGTAEC